MVKDVLEYRLAMKGFGTCPWIPKPDEYAFKEGDGSSHAVILEMLKRPAPVQGPGPRLLRRAVRRAGPRWATTSPASTTSRSRACANAPTEFLLADLNDGLPAEVGDRLRPGRRR